MGDQAERSDTVQPRQDTVQVQGQDQQQDWDSTYEDDVFAYTFEVINGDPFVVGAEGEVEEVIPKNVVYFGPNTPCATDATAGNRINFTAVQSQQFLKVNTIKLVQAGVPVRDAIVSAYLRLCGVKAGIISYHFSTAAHNVRYNDARVLSNVDWRTALQEFGAEANLPAQVATHLPVERAKAINRVYADIVCCVAFVFRARGHHYTDDLRERYDSLWARCLHTPSDKPAEWDILATVATHAIMPDILDNFWKYCVDNSLCAGALVKRYDAAAAGTAGILALKRGFDDIRMVFPNLQNNIPDIYEKFNNIHDQIKAGRWVGAINARFYGAPRVRIDENTVGVMASVVMGIYDTLAPDSQLRASPALQRLAQAAPVTGATFGQTARRTVQHEGFMLLST